MAEIQQLVHHIATIALELKDKSGNNNLNREQQRYVKKIYEHTQDFLEIHAGITNGFNRRGDIERLQELSTFMLGHAELLNFQLIGELNEQQAESVTLLRENGALLQQALTEIFPELAD